MLKNSLKTAVLLCRFIINDKDNNKNKVKKLWKATVNSNLTAQGLSQIEWHRQHLCF